VIADLPPGADGISLTLRPTDINAQAAVAVHEAYVVGLPEARTDLVSTAAKWTPDAKEASSRPQITTDAVLCDGNTYGPAVLQVPVGGEAPAEATGEWVVSLPEERAVVRGLIGLGADAPADSNVRVSLKLVGAEKEWPLISRLTIRAYAPGGDALQPSPRNWPAVVAVRVPDEARSGASRLVMSVSSDSTQPLECMIPSLFVCSG
jgi:hypothetical protein